MAYIFNSKIENPERLERMLVARRPLVDLLEKRAKALIDKGTLSQTLLIGPRGSGKTHMLKVFFNRVWNNPKREEKIVVAYMVEDEYGIDTFLDLLIRIFNAFMRWYENDKTKQLAEEIEKLKHTNPDQRESYAIDILNRYLNGRDLLIIIENLNDIFQGLGKQGQAKLRDYIQQYNNTAIFASSQALFSDIQQEDKPFQNFFNITHLKKLSYEEAMLLVNALAEEEKHDDFKAFLDTPRGKANVHAVFDLTQGNHRLLVTFFDFLKAEYKSDLAEAFLHTIDKLKPYYESYFKLLSPQQQKIVQYLSSKRKPVTGKDISLNSFIPHTTVSKQMSELQKLGYVESTKVGKEAFYEIAEPMLRLAFEINEDKKGIISIFIDFLTRVYEVEEITRQYLKFKYLSNFVDENLKIQYKKEATFYKEALNDNFKINLSIFESQLQRLSTQNEILLFINNLSIDQATYSEYDKQLNNVKALFNSKEYEECIKILESIESSEIPLTNDMLLLKGFTLFQLERFNDSERALKEVIRKDKTSHLSFLTLGLIYYKNKDYKNSIKALKKSLEIEPNQLTVLEGLAISYIELYQFEKAIKTLLKATVLDENKATNWFLLGKCYLDTDKLEEASFYFKKAVDLDPNNLDYLITIGNTYGSNEEYFEAEKAFKTALELDSFNPYIWTRLGDSLYFQEKYSEAEESYLKSSKYDKSDYYNFLSLGILNNEIENYSKAAEYLEYSLQLFKEDFDVYFNLSEAYENLGKINIAEKTLRTATKVIDNKEEPWIELVLFLINHEELEKANAVIKEYSQKFNSSEYHFLATLLSIFEGNKDFIKSRITAWINFSNTNEEPFILNFWELLKIISSGNKEDLTLLELFPNLFYNRGRGEEIDSYYSSLLIYTIQEIKVLGKDKLEYIYQVIQRSSITNELKEIWSSLLPIAIAYYLDNDRSALLALSKEERTAFLAFMEQEV